MIGGGDALPIAARAPIGDRSSGALVGADGTIDWWCPGPFDSPAAFFGLLDPAGGACRLGPVGVPVTGTQRWRGDGPVVSTELAGAETRVRIDDALIGGSIIRVLTVLRGPVDVMLDVVPGRRFGSPRKVEHFSSGVAFDGIVVRGLADAVAHRMDSGEQLVVSITVEQQGRVTTQGDGRAPQLTVGAALDQFSALDRQWRSWLENAYDGAHRTMVRNAMRQLMLLTDATSGGLVRSLTTSLPPHIGNDRNVDERYTWLGDVARLTALLEQLDRADLAEPTREWVAAALGSDEPVPSVFTSGGSRPNEERELELAGFHGHRPVRVGISAEQSQWLAGLAEATLVLDARRHRAALTRVTAWLTAHANDVDHGRWGARGRPRRYVDSALAVRRALRAAALTLRSGDPLSEVASDGAATAAGLDRWLADNGCFGVADRAGWRRALGDDSSDAALLRWVAPADDELAALPHDGEGEALHRSRLTVDQTLAQLDDGGLTHRHLPHVDDGFAPGEGADVAASAELVAALARIGRWEDAHARMETLLAAVGSMTVASSHVDPRTHNHLGNTPSTPALMALVEAALALRAGPR